MSLKRNTSLDACEWPGLEALETRLLLHGGALDSGQHSDPNPTHESQIQSNVQKLSQVTLSDIPGGSALATDIWGYVSPSGREYAILGLAKGTAFIDVTEPRNPSVIEFVAGSDEWDGRKQCWLCWRDMKVYDQYAYVTNERFDIGEFELSLPSGGLQIIDLTQIDQGSVAAIGTLTQDGLDTAHNIAINPESGFAYVTGSNIAHGGLVVLDVATNPASPTIVGTWSENYIHDAEVVTYTTGPFAGREIAFGFAGPEGVKIIDVTDKSNMFAISTQVYPDISYAHYGALSEDREYLFVNDELDELFNDNVTLTTTYVLDVEDLANPTFVTSFTNGLPATDHNLRIRGDLLFEANYDSGLRIFDVSDVHNVQEIGFYDTYLKDNRANIAGAWGVFTDLPSGIVVVSDMRGGLFVLDPTDHDRHIHGMQWNDLNGNGEIDTDIGETPLEGWTVYLDLNENGQLDPVGSTTLTFQQGIDGYDKTHDTFLKEFDNTPKTTEPFIEVHGIAEKTVGLLQFRDLFGTGAKTIPPHATSSDVPVVGR